MMNEAKCNHDWKQTEKKCSDSWWVECEKCGVIGRQVYERDGSTSIHMQSDCHIRQQIKNGTYPWFEKEWGLLDIASRLHHRMSFTIYPMEYHEYDSSSTEIHPDSEAQVERAVRSVPNMVRLLKEYREFIYDHADIMDEETFRDLHGHRLDDVNKLLDTIGVSDDTCHVCGRVAVGHNDAGTRYCINHLQNKVI